jgi:uncharacterized protein
MMQRNDPDGLRLPVKLDSTSNGEFEPVPLEPQHEHANRLAMENATANARRLGLSRRDFLVSASGAATTLLAMNAAYAAVGNTGGFFQLSADAALDADAAEAALAGKEFIFDVQGHFVNPTGAWTRRLPEGARPLGSFSTQGCAAAELPGPLDRLQCFGPDAFIRDVFLDSDTSLVVLSFVPSTREGEPLTIEEAAATAAIVERLEGSHRLYLHGRVNPNQPGDLEDMERLATEYGISAWKTYTQWGPDGAAGFWMDDEPGLAMIENARRLGVPTIAIHKGLPFGQRSYEHSTCADIGRVGKRFPDVNFLIYHSGFVTGQAEGPYDPARSRRHRRAGHLGARGGLGHGSNVYAELGSTWRFLMRDPTSAAHGIGKLLKHLGPGQRPVGHRLDLVRQPAGPDPGLPQLPDRARAARAAWLPGDHAGDPRQGVRPQRAEDLPGEPEAVLGEHLGSDLVARERANYRNRPDPATSPTGRRPAASFSTSRPGAAEQRAPAWAFPPRGRRG